MGVRYDITSSNKLALGFQAALQTGTLTAVDVSSGGVKTHVRLEKGNYENLAHIDLQYYSIHKPKVFLFEGRWETLLSNRCKTKLCRINKISLEMKTSECRGEEKGVATQRFLMIGAFSLVTARIRKIYFFP
ncbi:MAG: hypothetical protein ABIS36_15465 [Chryseolinea sp.]